MKKVLVVALLVTLTACQKTTSSGPIEGTPIKGQVKAYTEMCEREPASTLCVVEKK